MMAAWKRHARLSQRFARLLLDHPLLTWVHVHLLQIGTVCLPCGLTS